MFLFRLWDVVKLQWSGLEEGQPLPGLHVQTRSSLSWRGRSPMRPDAPSPPNQIHSTVKWPQPRAGFQLQL